MGKQMFEEAGASALGYTVVARSRSNPNDILIITEGLDDWRAAEGVQGYHTKMQVQSPSYYEGYYISVMNPSEYTAWLAARGKIPICRCCGRTLTPAR